MTDIDQHCIKRAGYNENGDFVMNGITNSGFADMLGKLMAERHITQSELAREIGVGRGTVQHWLSGRTEPRVSEGFRIAEHFNMSVYELFGKSESVTPHDEHMMILQEIEELKKLCRKNNIAKEIKT